MNQYDLQNQALIQRVRQEELQKAALRRAQSGQTTERFGLPQPLLPPVGPPPINTDREPLANSFGALPLEEALALLSAQLKQRQEPALTKTSAAREALVPPAARKRKKVTPKGQETPATNTSVPSVDNASPYAKAAGKLGGFNFDFGPLVGSTPAAGGSPLLQASPTPAFGLPSGVESTPMALPKQKMNPILRALTLGIAGRGR